MAEAHVSARQLFRTNCAWWFWLCKIFRRSYSMPAASPHTQQVGNGEIHKVQHYAPTSSTTLKPFHPHCCTRLSWLIRSFRSPKPYCSRINSPQHQLDLTTGQNRHVLLLQKLAEQVAGAFQGQDLSRVTLNLLNKYLGYPSDGAH